MENSCKCKVLLTDGCKMLFDNVSDYGLAPECRYAFVVSDGYKHFFNIDYVEYMGRVVDLDGET